MAQQTEEVADTSVRVAVADTSVSVADSSVNIDTSTQIAADTLIYHTVIDTSVPIPAAAAVDTAGDSSITAPVESLDTPALATQDTLVPDAKEPFRLPGYTFHVLFLLASAAVIAVTVRFFLKLRRRNDSRRFLTTTRLSVLDKSVQRGCRYVEANYHDPALTAENVCRSLVTGKACLDALFMNELGINVQDFIIQVRVNAIKNLIASTPTPDINEICAKCGFADRDEAERHFSSICRGVSIIDYARDNRGAN
jgi:AraC-like DNA-binding protein